MVSPSKFLALLEWFSSWMAFQMPHEQCQSIQVDITLLKPMNCSTGTVIPAIYVHVTVIPQNNFFKLLKTWVIKFGIPWGIPIWDW